MKYNAEDSMQHDPKFVVKVTVPHLLKQSGISANAGGELSGDDALDAGYILCLVCPV